MINGIQSPHTKEINKNFIFPNSKTISWEVCLFLMRSIRVEKMFFSQHNNCPRKKKFIGHFYILLKIGHFKIFVQNSSSTVYDGNLRLCPSTLELQYKTTRPKIFSHRTKSNFCLENSFIYLILS